MRKREGVTDFADARQSVHDLLRQELNPAAKQQRRQRWVGDLYSVHAPGIQTAADRIHEGCGDHKSGAICRLNES